MAGNELPIEQIKSLKGQGYNNNQIIAALQRAGYNSTQIFDALNQAQLVSGQPSSQAPPTPTPSQMNNQSEQQNMGRSNVGFSGSNEEVEELVETIIEEKLSSMTKDFDNLSEWKNDIQTKITRIEANFESLKKDFDNLHQAIIGKIGEYDKNILTVGAEIKAMEKVFSKVLPVFTDNVNELSRITDNMKKN